MGSKEKRSTMSTLEETPTYNLGVVVQETGINPDTLRAWERRYGLPQPERTEGGHRIYSRRDIETVKWLIARQEEGLRISQAVRLWKEIIQAGRDPFQEQRVPGEGSSTTSPVPREREGEGEGVMIRRLRDEWLEAALSYDPMRADYVFSEALARFSEEVATYQVLLKGLEEVGERWYRGDISVQNEHFITSLAKRRVQALIFALPAPIREQKIVVACPPKERHTFSALLITLFLGRQGYPVLYLGADVPGRDFDDMLHFTSSRMVIFSANLLSTAAQVFDIAGQLVEDGIPVGYGGRVFNHIPSLRESMPGLFLGEDFKNIAPRVEGVLKDPSPALEKKAGLPDGYLSLRDAVDEHLGGIQQRIKDWGDQEGLDPVTFETAQQRFTASLLASLALGDLGLLEKEWAWVAGFLSHRGWEESALDSYLERFNGSLKEELGSQAQLITEWFQDQRSSYRGG
ncbi:MAG: MerR family transcriptional regulator [Anaerolineales bacterium]|nr:MerR family transcriptional regulator [Anaerolineales bacterium]